MDMKPTLLVLAAGMGSRYGGLKQLDQFGPSGETIIEYSLYDAIRAGFGKIVFVVREKFEAEFRNLFHDKLSGRVAVEYVPQELYILPPGFAVPEQREKPWGTAHAVWVTAGKIREPFAVINGDDFYGRHSFQLIADFLRAVPDPDARTWCLVGFKLAHTLSEHGHVARGVCQVDREGLLQRVTELTRIRVKNGTIRYDEPDGNQGQLTGAETVSMNMMGFTPALYSFCEKYLKEFLEQQGHNPKAEFYLPKLVNQLVKADQARVRVLDTPEEWFGVTYPEDKPLVVENLKALVAAGVYPADLWGGQVQGDMAKEYESRSKTT
jgi:hypothetical protein